MLLKQPLPEQITNIFVPYPERLEQVICAAKFQTTQAMIAIRRFDDLVIT